jgi:hypothetical protein
MAVAESRGVDLLSKASMNCPICQRRAEPLDGSTWVIAWYSCDDCGHFWSARLRGGIPVPEVHAGEPIPESARRLID